VPKLTRFTAFSLKTDRCRAVRLKYIGRADFRKSELTNYVELNCRSLKADEVACLVSSTGQQIVFVYALESVSRVLKRGDEVESLVLRSVRLRLTNGGRWDPMMLGNYAKEVGLHLEGIKLFETHYKKLWTQEGR